MRKLLLAVYGLAAILVSANAWAVTELAANAVQVKYPQILVNGANHANAEVSMDLVNQGSQEHVLIAAASPMAKQVLLHQTVRVGNQEQMQRISSIVIKPKSDDVLQPSGLHVMLIGFKQQIMSGQVIPVTLIFADGSSIDFGAKING